MLQDGTSVAYRLTSPVTFESGRKYTLHMTISFTDIDITTSISDWVGGDDPIVAVSDTVRFAVHYTDGTSEETMTVDTDTIRFNSTGKTVHSIELLDHDTTYLIGRKDITGIVLNLDKEGNLGFRPAVEGYIPIGSYAEMQHINTLSPKNGRYRQEADIDLLNEPWVPISTFYGEFDGNGYEISNILISPEKATLTNIHIISGSVAVSKSNASGTICGTADESVIEHCTNKADADGPYMFGGIVGEIANGSIISYCTNYGDISSNSNGNGCGGIAGYANTIATIEFCENYGTISVNEGSSVGGIMGQSSRESIYIENCKNSGSISVSGQNIHCGGIIGAVSTGRIIACCNNGSITATSNGSAYCGGIAGSSSSTIISCYNSGFIYPYAPQTGLLVIGGIVGTQSGESITACYYTGSFSTNSSTYRINAGSILGELNTTYAHTMAACYWKEDAGFTVAFGEESDYITMTDVFSFNGTFTPDAAAHPEWGIGDGGTYGWWKNYDGNGGLPQLWWEE